MTALLLSRFCLISEQWTIIEGSRCIVYLDILIKCILTQVSLIKAIWTQLSLTKATLTQMFTTYLSPINLRLLDLCSQIGFFYF